MNLSKSKYCNAVQCPKMLWLSKYKKEVFDDTVMNQSVLEQGNEVGDLAMGLFGDYEEVPYGNLSDMIQKTKELLNTDTKVIAEASFSYNGLFCSVDILKKGNNKHIQIYEVKSASEVHDIYYDDVAYQCYVLSKLGYIIDRACVIHINSSYVRGKDLELKQLFVIVDITKEVERKYNEVELNIELFKNCLNQKDEPNKEISISCFEPYQCGFFKYCTRNLPEPNIFDVARLSKKKKIKYFNEGVVSFEDLYDRKDLTESYLKQVEHEVRGLEAEIDVEAIKQFVNKLHYPIYFLDFETFSSAIPLYENSSPYQQIPFQYSLHFIEYEDGPLQHKEFLAEAGKDPRRKLAERLCNDIPKGVCVTAYNMGFEKGRIKELSELYPDLAEHLMDIHRNIIDLMVPFQKKQYYQKEMKGSYSIKYVLPALFPNVPELNYSNLEGVHNGSEASNAFRRMAEMEDQKVVQYREYLLKYCMLDTYAMVKIWERLNEVVGIRKKTDYICSKILDGTLNNTKNDYVKNDEIVLIPDSEDEEDASLEILNCRTKPNANTKFCSQCGVKLRDITKFCSECGSKIEEDGLNNEEINRNSAVKKIVEKINMEANKICCWEIHENVILHNFWSESFTVTDLRNPAVIEVMNSLQVSYRQILEHWQYYMKDMEKYQVLINRPIWISNVVDNKIFYIDNCMDFFKCTFELNNDMNERWKNVQYLYSKNEDIRILARDDFDGELTTEFYLFNQEGNILWKADRPVKLDGYNREIGYEFSCDENYFSNNQMLVDFYTGDVVLKDAFAIVSYIEKETNSFMLDCVKMKAGDKIYQHEVYYYNNGKLIPTNEKYDSIEVVLSLEKYIPAKQERTDFKKLENVKENIQQDFMQV